jgi:two-component system chemotaxis response regulator CheB
MTRVSVLIVEDSPVAQRLLAHAVATDPRLQVAGIAGDAEQAMRLIAASPPDVVSMDVRLPGENGLALTRRIMESHPLPIVVVASDLNDRSLDISMNALKAGALSVVEKPPGTGHRDWEAMARSLCTHLFIMSQVPVNRQAPAVARGAHPASGWRGDWGVVAMGASTGGPAALARILGALPEDFELPVVLVQHIGTAFTPGFVTWLASVSPLPVDMVVDGGHLEAGRVAVAPGGSHTRILSDRLSLDDGPPVLGQKPSVDVLLESASAAFGRRGLGVLLTGMGEDGARGLAALRQAGGYTIAEDASSAVVWGMPGAAVQLGAAIEVLPVDDIAPRLVALARGNDMGRRKG